MRGNRPRTTYENGRQYTLVTSLARGPGHRAQGVGASRQESLSAILNAIKELCVRSQNLPQNRAHKKTCHHLMVQILLFRAIAISALYWPGFTLLLCQKLSYDNAFTPYFLKNLIAVCARGVVREMMEASQGRSFWFPRSRAAMNDTTLRRRVELVAGLLRFRAV